MTTTIRIHSPIKSSIVDTRKWTDIRIKFDSKEISFKELDEKLPKNYVQFTLSDTRQLEENKKICYTVNIFLVPEQKEWEESMKTKAHYLSFDYTDPVLYQINPSTPISPENKESLVLWEDNRCFFDDEKQSKIDKYLYSLGTDSSTNTIEPKLLNELQMVVSLDSCVSWSAFLEKLQP